MPVTLHIHPCRTARDRDEAHKIERRLDLKRRNPDFCAARDELQRLLPKCTDAPEMVVHHHADELGRTSVTVLRRFLPYLTLSQSVE